MNFTKATASYEAWLRISEDLAGAPKVLGVGDFHVENFGTWRDAAETGCTTPPSAC
jgi:uncharacterized protein (DUF2252 family)